VRTIGTVATVGGGSRAADVAHLAEEWASTGGVEQTSSIRIAVSKISMLCRAAQDRR
jgi:hypothetical protein